MNNPILLRFALRAGALGSSVALLSITALADYPSFRVAFAQVPGIDEIEAGRYDEAIEILENRRKLKHFSALDDELTTLCGVYIVDRQYEKAGPVCNEAVRKHDSEAAYNNRGVYRAYSGDTEGALDDFARIRIEPASIDAYIEYITQGNPRLMASNNFELVQKVRATARRAEGDVSLVVNGARVEELTPQ